MLKLETFYIQVKIRFCDRIFSFYLLIELLMDYLAYLTYHNHTSNILNVLYIYQSL